MQSASSKNKSARVTTSDGMEVPQGNTTAGVNRAILEYLVRLLQGRHWRTLLDIPCGHGHFVATAERYTSLKGVGADLLEEPKHIGSAAYYRIDAAHPPSWQAHPHKYDIITCISGVMEFGNTGQFIEFCHEHLNDDGVFIVTNDSMVTVQDRLLYALLGRTRRLKLTRVVNRSVWNLIPMPALVGMLHGSGFEIEHIEHILRHRKDLWMLPFALILYPLLHIYVRFSRFFEKRELPRQLRTQMYPLRSLYCSHYIVFCRKRRQAECESSAA